MYVASGTTAHHNLFKLLLWVDLDLFFGKVKFNNSGFYKEKCDSDGFFLKLLQILTLKLVDILNLKSK